MEDSFSVRVDKTFGFLAGSSASVPSSSLSSLWSLTGEEIEKREWNRDKGSPEPELRPCKDDFFGTELEKDLLDLDDDDDVEEEHEGVEEQQQLRSSSTQSAKPMPDDYNEEQWEIKSSIGLDCTLDHEEEEDEFDKVAVGKENAGDRFYMKDVNDYPIDIDSQYEVPNSLKDFTRDPRANHLAAKIRLKQDAEAAAQIRLQEDAEAARKIDSLQVSGNSAPSADQFIPSEDAVNLKSILKRKNDNQLGSSKLQKRVRFDPECKDSCDEEPEGSKDIPVESLPGEDHVSAVPDYIRNPSRYTHYTFDSATDMDEEANMRSYMDLRNLLGKSNTMEAESPRDFSKPVIFTPKKKSTDATMLEIDGELERPVGASKEFAPCRVMPIAIAASDNEDGDVCAMEEDEPETGSSGRTSLQRTSRQFRTRTSLQLDE
ncbi:hypothetical protein M0R45_033908 [Rubus argutus]|uniref:U5 small nuclear ribonucleoprotein TSSC4 n=1 Tax=Rubus argutus TaxID=59490 RepID=A0AAW1WPS1_RUBAR